MAKGPDLKLPVKELQVAICTPLLLTRELLVRAFNRKGAPAFVLQNVEQIEPLYCDKRLAVLVYDIREQKDIHQSLKIFRKTMSASDIGILAITPAGNADSRIAAYRSGADV